MNEHTTLLDAENGTTVLDERAEKPVQDQAARDAAKAQETYAYGFSSDIEQDFAPKGLNEDTVRFISAKKNEPEWMLDWRLKAFRLWQTMEAPNWAKLKVDPIDYQDAFYYAEPRKKPSLESLDELDPEIKAVYDKLGIPIAEQEVLAGVEGARKVAVDAVFDSVSVATTFRAELEKAGVIFRSISEAIREYPDLVRKWLGKVVPQRDNFFATLNSAVFSDGTFVYIPEGVRCPMELSTYFRINAENTGQFERTLIVAEKGSYVSYLEGCTAPMRDENQLHAAVVELVAMEDAEIKYSTVQNWYPGDKDGKGGIFNFVTKRGLCQGDRSKISWTQVETGSAITWKYPSCVLNGEDSVGEFYSVALTNNHQQADTGTKMIHNGKGSRSTIISKGISAGQSDNTYRGLVRVGPNADNVRNFTQCDSLLLGDRCGAHTVPYIEVKNPSAQIEHEATTSKISDDQLFYAMQRGLDEEEAVALIVNGFAKDVMRQLPMEFAVEAQKLLAISLEGSVG
ncbi:Fe-S cluster assembly protein SufB [Altererythrobacter sp. SALINAS58]|uniref:Fe-S cluster assembly protein SufB n=1 Tax=Alteripontixanthobacter muriae TaxID=2705546 RepID=UPI0015760526|nr:Fe-S cluster assembly protein SufB [Alteripontixanthobacter muriae]NTZ43572.1 Fe-S cluster assembly protein SufB [Alteripontixanthobacter muriae]